MAEMDHVLAAHELVDGLLARHGQRVAGALDLVQDGVQVGEHLVGGGVLRLRRQAGQAGQRQAQVVARVLDLLQPPRKVGRDRRVVHHVGVLVQLQHHVLRPIITPSSAKPSPTGRLRQGVKHFSVTPQRADRLTAVVMLSPVMTRVHLS